MIQGPQKQCSQVSGVQIHKYKYTNAASAKVAGMSTKCYIFEKVMVKVKVKVKDLKNKFSICHTNTYTQRHKYTNTALVKKNLIWGNLYLYE